MTSEKLEYDSAIGGHVVLPEHIETYRYAASHINEIKDLLTSIQNPTSNKLIFQTLPKHMRRRAMSHHPKRLPRRYRGIHKSQMSKAGNPQQTKRPSRKYRRKPSNLLKEYLRRQQKNIWLETHIWHAKRFHMIPKWGYKLPLSSCDKTYRSCYRATTKHCLLQDISYYCCIELEGNLEIIREKFQYITSNKCGLGICAKAFTTGKREGNIHLFRSNQYPYGALGKVNFLWKPEVEMNLVNTKRILWIFIHPSMYNEILEEIIKIFELISLKTIKVPIEDEDKIEIDEPETSKKVNKKEKKKNTQLKFMTKTFAYSRAPKYENKNSDIILTELKDTMNRFRLTGPLAQSVLANALKPKKYSNNEPVNWFKSEMENSVNLDAHSIQTRYWNTMKNIKSPGELIPNIILALNIEDPRLNRPNKRTKALPDNSIIDSTIYYEFPNNLSYSSIWNFNLRNSLAEKMMPTNEFCALRNKNCLVPGERCEFENNLQPIPILLIQRPGSQHNHYKQLGYGCGWDIIIPSGYGISLWLSLIMWGAKSGGLREMHTIKKESGYDEFLPDTISGLKESSERYMVLKEKYFRLPPNKRCNYTKFAICSPFKAPLNQLIKEWSLVDNNKFYILRDKEILQEILKCYLRNQSLPIVNKGCLIQISLKMKTRGNPGDFSLICLPKNEDFRTNLKRIKKFSNEPVYIEPLRIDDNENERKLLKREHKKLLKRLRSKRIREKRKKQETSQLRVKIRPAETINLVKEQFKKMCSLWLTENPITIRNQCTREVFGYITTSDFSLIEATVTGIGYITIEGLEKLMKLQNYSRADKMVVLVRGTKSRNYRFASFKINCNL